MVLTNCARVYFSKYIALPMYVFFQKSGVIILVVLILFIQCSAVNPGKCRQLLTKYVESILSFAKRVYK